MDILTDEHEREEAVRKWWHEHWKPITLGIVIALAGLVGYRQYEAYQLSENQKVAYEVYQLQSQLSSRGIAVVADAQKFLDNHQDVYGSILALDMAAVQIRANKLEDATKSIDFAKKNGGDLIAPQASLTLARLQAQQKQYDEAITTLASIKSDAYKADIAEVKGDILLAKGDRQGAHDAYLEAIKVNQAAKLQISGLLQLKFDSVIQKGDTPAYKISNEQLSELTTVPVN